MASKRRRFDSGQVHWLFKSKEEWPIESSWEEIPCRTLRMPGVGSKVWLLEADHL